MDQPIDSVGAAGAKLLYNIDEHIAAERNLSDRVVEGRILPRFNLCYNYNHLASWSIVTRSHEETKAFFMIFKPFLSNRDTPKQKRNAMDHVRKKIMDEEVDDVIITREILATRIHFNALVFCKKDLSHLNDKKTSRYFITCKQVPYADKYKVHDYIVKESRVRFFYSNATFNINDIYVASRNEKGQVCRYYNSQYDLIKSVKYTPEPNQAT